MYTVNLFGILSTFLNIFVLDSSYETDCGSSNLTINRSFAYGFGPAFEAGIGKPDQLILDARPP